MNDKQPKYYNIKELFSSDDYVIPIYQRNYEWGESQITQLIQDIVDYIKKDNCTINEKPNYYIGTLILYERKNGGKTIYETIDGQQRLTTLTLLLNVIKKEYQTIEHTKIDLSWYKKLNLSFDSRKIASDTLSYLFNGENVDNKECNVDIQQGYYDTKKSLAKILADNKLEIEDFCSYFFEKVIILKVLVPEDTDLNHYFEIMNSRGEQLEKHEILKAKMLEVLEDDNLKYAFNLIWEATSNMEKYVQYGFSVDQRNAIFGEKDWNNLVNNDTVYEKLQMPAVNQSTKETLSDLLEKTPKIISDNLNTTDESPDRFNTIINFSNFLLHILRIQTKSDVPLDDKRLLELFEPFLKNDDKKEFVKQFGYNLLKGKFYFDKYIIKREFVKGTDHWSLKRLKWYEGNRVSYVNTFDADDAESNEGINREILMLLSMFHVSYRRPLGTTLIKDRNMTNSEFKQAAKKHQVSWREQNIRKEYNTYVTWLTDKDGNEGKNFFDSENELGLGIFQAVKERYPNYYVDLYSDTLRSEHIPFNLFVPFRKDLEFCKNVFNEFLNGSIKSIENRAIFDNGENIKIEFAPSPKENYLNDRTSFDTYIEYTHNDNSKGVIGIEVKYTEKEYKLKAGSTEECVIKNVKESKYYEISKKSDVFDINTIDTMITDVYRQVWRNHLLAESIRLVNNDTFKHATSMIFYPNGNTHFAETSKKYIAMLLNTNNKFVPVTYEDFLNACYKHCPNNNFKEWLNYLTNRYIVS